MDEYVKIRASFIERILFLIFGLINKRNIDIDASIDNTINEINEQLSHINDKNINTKKNGSIPNMDMPFFDDENGDDNVETNI